MKKRNIKRYTDLRGKRFGKLVVLSYSHTSEKGRSAIWNVICDCGKTSEKSGNSLRMGTVKSCGCGIVEGLKLGWQFWKGKHRPEKSGENCHLWRGGIYPKNLAARQTLEYKNWRKSVFERDNYTCVLCGVKGGELNADHIKPFCAFEDNRLDLDNGRTLCVPCHRTTDTWGEGAKKFKKVAGLLA